MPTRQYIGARYVPKFADPIQWNQQTAYEALTIVTYLGASYTSKKAVPAGTEITNAEYWVATGNYNSQIQEYIDDVEAVKEQIYNARKYRNIVVIGDSYCTHNGGTVTIDHSLPEQIQSFLGLPNAQFHAAAQNGAGFGNGIFTTLLSSVITGMTTDAKNAVTDVYFIGGWNDEANRVTQSEFLVGVASCETLIDANFPNAIKHVALAANTRVSYHSNLYTTKGWYDNLAQRGWSCIKNLRYVLTNPLYVITDGAHPSQAGVNILAMSMVDAILNGEVNFKTRFQILLSGATFITGWSCDWSVSGATLTVDIDNATTLLSFNFGTANKTVIKFMSGDSPTTKNVQINGGTAKIADLDDNTIAGATNNCGAYLHGYFIDNAGTRYEGDFYLYLKDSEIWIQYPYIVNESWTAITASNLIGLVLEGGKGSVSTDFF